MNIKNTAAMKNIFALIGLLFFAAAEKATAQNFPEQDCIGAVKACNDGIITAPVSYSGYGEIRDLVLISDYNCLKTGEDNSAWFYFEIDSPGMVVFTIAPLQNDDYDFAVYLIDSNHSCADIQDSNFLPVRCSYYAMAMNTGLLYGATHTGSGVADTPFLAPLSVLAGEKYYLLVDNFNIGGGGFTLDFTGSTAKFNADTSQNITKRNLVGYTSVFPQNIRLEFDVPFNCTQANTNAADYTVTGASVITVDSVSFPCTQNETEFIDLFYSGNFIDGADYTIYFKDSALVLLNNNLTLLCGSSYLANDSAYQIVANAAPFFDFSFTIQVYPLNLTGSPYNYSIYISPSSPYFLYADDPDFVPDYSRKTVSFGTPGIKEVCAVGWNRLFADTICRTVEVVLGVEDNQLNNEITISPNPVSDLLHITAAVTGNRSLQYKIVNTLGKIISEDHTEEKNFSVAVSALSAGVYYLHFQSGSASAVKRFVKQ
jgi:hypothetical protein